MHIESYCSLCRASHVCKVTTTKPKYSNYKNIVIFLKCSDFRLPDNSLIKAPPSGSEIPSHIKNLRHEFNHCNDCKLTAKCKYKRQAMLEDINRVTADLINDGVYDNDILVTCNAYISENETDDSSRTAKAGTDKTKKLSIFRRKKNENV